MVQAEKKYKAIKLNGTQKQILKAGVWYRAYHATEEGCDLVGLFSTAEQKQAVCRVLDQLQLTQGAADTAGRFGAMAASDQNQPHTLWIAQSPASVQLSAALGDYTQVFAGAEGALAALAKRSVHVPAHPRGVGHLLAHDIDVGGAEGPEDAVLPSGGASR